LLPFKSQNMGSVLMFPSSPSSPASVPIQSPAALPNRSQQVMKGLIVVLMASPRVLKATMHRSIRGVDSM
jgi:hypothetical protein